MEREVERERLLNELQESIQNVVKGFDAIQEQQAQVVRGLEEARAKLTTLCEASSSEDSRFHRLHGAVQLNRHTINELSHESHNLREDLNFYSTHLTGVEGNTIPPLERRVRDLELGNDMDGVLARLAAMEDRINDQHEEIAMLRGRVCRCVQPVRIEEDEEGIEVLYANEAPPGR